jgi:hypothetical protein
MTLGHLLLWVLRAKEKAGESQEEAHEALDKEPT